VPHHDRRKRRVVGGPRLLRPGHRLIGIAIEGGEHLRQQRGHLRAPVRGAQRQPHHLQADIGAAAFIGDREAIARDADFAPADQADADRTRAGHHDGAISAAVGAETRRHAVADEDGGGKGMRDVLQRRLRAAAAKAGNADGGVHPRKIRMRKPGLGGRRLRRRHDRAPRLLDADPRRGGP